MLRKINLLLLLCSLIAISGRANTIDELKTNEEVEHFLHKADKDFKDFSLSDIKMIYIDSIQRHLADSLGVRVWQKADLDNNGLTDLLVNGNWNGSDNHLIAVLDMGKSVAVRDLNRGFFDNNYFPVITSLQGQTILILHKGLTFSWNINEHSHIVRTDSLVYKFGDFVELNHRPANYSIQQIEFSTTECFGSCPVFELKINANRNASYHAQQYNDLSGKFNTLIDTIHLKELIDILNYLDFPKLKDNYEVNWTDDQSCTLVVTYDNGKKKTISDYGEIGTNGLSLLYSKLFALRKNQQWQ